MIRPRDFDNTPTGVLAGVAKADSLLAMKRALNSPWLVALAVLGIAALPVWAAIAAYREQARWAEALLFERSAEIAVGQFRLVTARQVGWLATLRSRVSNRPEAPEKFLNEMLTPGAWSTVPENCRVLAYGASDGGKVVLRWQRVKTGAALGQVGDDLLHSPEISRLLRAAMAKPAQVQSAQVGLDLLTIMTVADSAQSQPRGWVIAAWNLDAMCADPQLRLVVTDHTLTARPFEAPLRSSERMIEIGEGGARWRVAVGKGTGFAALFPRVSEKAIMLTGGGCALLLALLAGFATRAAGWRAALASERELVRMKDHLLHSVSHEFRTPLSVILSSADLLESYADRLQPQRRAEAFTQIRHSTSRMNEMIEQVLLLSRIDASRLPIEPRSIDVAVVARELSREIETASQERCPIHVTAPDSLDATVDPTLLRAVLGNLLSNAVKFSPAGSPVEFVIQRDESLRFIIRDHGPGIATDDLSRVREPYFRTASAATIPGSGLGLTIADKCTALLGGTLAITSDDSNGITATLTI